MKAWSIYLRLVLVLPAHLTLAQRPTAEVVQSAVSFWPQEAGTGRVAFSAPTRHAHAPALQQAEHARMWLTTTCGSAWTEWQTAADSAQRYQGLLPGVHEGVVLRFALHVSRQPTERWQYYLFACQVSSPTPAGITHWLPLHQLLDDPDFRTDVLHFQHQLQRALPGL